MRIKECESELEQNKSKLDQHEQRARKVKQMKVTAEVLFKDIE